MPDTATTHPSRSAYELARSADQLADAAARYRRDVRGEHSARSLDLAPFGYIGDLAHAVAELAELMAAATVREGAPLPVAVRYRTTGGPWQYMDALDPAVELLPEVDAVEIEHLYR